MPPLRPALSGPPCRRPVLLPPVPSHPPSVFPGRPRPVPPHPLPALFRPLRRHPEPVSSPAIRPACPPAFPEPSRRQTRVAPFDGTLMIAPALRPAGCNPPLSSETCFRRPEAACERIERLARRDHVVGVSLVGHAVQILAVALPLGLHGARRLRAALLAADEDALAGPQPNGVERRIVLDEGPERDGIAARNGIERLALGHGVGVERLAQFALRRRARRLRREGYLELRARLQPSGRGGIETQDHPFAHAVGPRQSVERFALPDGVDIVFRAVDHHDRLRLSGRERRSRAPQEHHEDQTESLHRRDLTFGVVLFAEAQFRDYLLGVEREIAVHHPCVVARLCFEHLADRTALVLAESEDLHPFVVVDDAAGVVDALAARRIFGQRVHVVGQIVVAVELGLQHLVGRRRVGFGRVGVFELLAAIEAVGRHQRALLLLVEDVLHVDEPPPLEVHVDARTHELLDQNRQIEAVRVETAEVAAADELFERLGHLREGRALLHVVVRDAVHGRSLLRDVHPGIEAACFRDLLAVGHDLDQRDLDDAVLRRIHAGGFEVEEDDGAFEVELHFGAFAYALIIIGMSSMSVELVCLSS